MVGGVFGERDLIIGLLLNYSKFEILYIIKIEIFRVPRSKRQVEGSGEDNLDDEDDEEYFYDDNEDLDDEDE